MHDLQGDLTLEPEVVATMHGGHASTGDELLDLVTSVEEHAGVWGSGRRRAHVAHCRRWGRRSRTTTPMGVSGGGPGPRWWARVLATGPG